MRFKVHIIYGVMFSSKTYYATKTKALKAMKPGDRYDEMDVEVSVDEVLKFNEPEPQECKTDLMVAKIYTKHMWTNGRIYTNRSLIKPNLSLEKCDKVSIDVEKIYFDFAKLLEERDNGRINENE